MDKKKNDSLLDALFGIDTRPKSDSLLDAIFNVDSGKDSGWSTSSKRKKRPWQSDKVECRNCGSLMPVGRTCPGCGLHNEEVGR